MKLNSPSYEGRPIASVPSLARALGISIARLVRVASNSERLYRGPIVIRRPGKKPRETFDAKPELKDIHQRILDRIFSLVSLPDYLMGGIKGRSYIGDARLHVRSKLLCGQDITAFYPSISKGSVISIFQDVFHFPLSVSTMLACLCTRQGVVVQGGKTSMCIANLALYRTEPALEQEARRLGFRYSRFVDDAQTSSRHRVPPTAITQLVGKMRSAYERHGYRPNRDKQYVTTASRPMRVHNLNVNQSASAPKKVRQRLRNQVFLVVRWAESQSWDDALERQYLRLCTHVGQLRQTNPGEARRLRSRLDRLSIAREAYKRAPRITGGTDTAATLGGVPLASSDGVRNIEIW